MSRRQVIECDRCGTVRGEDAVDREAWARAYVATFAGQDVVGSSQTPADLRGDCVADLKKFMMGERND